MSNVERCVCCGRIIPEGAQVCPLCAKGARHAATPSILGVSDVQQELHCTRHEAKEILERFGKKPAGAWGISLRELRLRQLSGDIATVLSGEARAIDRAVALLKKHGYKIEKDGNEL